MFVCLAGERLKVKFSSMFAEVEFEEEPFTEPQRRSRSTTEDHGVANEETNSSSSPSAIVHFHLPGMKDFSVVAGASQEMEEEESKFDPRLFNGDSWLSTECHCLKCEGLRVVQKVRLLRPPPILILLDLDNFGFRQFQLCPPRLRRSSRLSNEDILSSIFLWGFFGSCFTRYHKVWPTDDLVIRLDEEMEKEDMHGSQIRKESIWRRVAKENRLLLTPCSGRNQGADCVMRDVVNAFSGSDMIVVTGDAELIHLLKEDRRLRRKRAFSHSDMTSSSMLGFVNITTQEKKLVPVWQALADQIARMRSFHTKDSAPT